jgi:hypothetical protein
MAVMQRARSSLLPASTEPDWKHPATRRFIRRDLSVEIRCCSFRGTTAENFWTTSRPFTNIVAVGTGEVFLSDCTPLRSEIPIMMWGISEARFVCFRPRACVGGAIAAFSSRNFLAAQT